LKGSIEYSTALYKGETIARMAKHFVELCRAIVARPAARIQELEYVGKEERQRVLVEFNDTRVEYPRDKCIHDFFVEQVEQNPGARAVVCGEEQLTYQQLHERSRDLAMYLQELGVKPDSVVGLCMERSLEMMVGILGTVQAGGAYLPLDPGHPEERVAYMLEDSEVGIVLTQDKYKNKIRSWMVEEARIISLDGEWGEVSERATRMRREGKELRCEAEPEHAVYVIYTSGSTGKPKGVVVEHRALVNRIEWMQKRYGLEAGEVVLQKTPYSFDVSVWEFFWPMMAGATVVMAAPEGHKDVGYLEEVIEERQVTTLHFVPSMLHTFLENGRGEWRSVKRIFSSGEALDRRSAEVYRKRFPEAGLHNLYGPTEAAIDVTAYECGQVAEAFVPIGRPIANTQIYILDEQQQVQPIGVPGELYIAGEGLARGYLNRPELTRERFVANPFAPGTRMYRTGDRARWLEDGNIQYLGRMDAQVKIRGFRIELGEIEARLNQHPEIEDSVVMVRGEESNKQLMVFYRA
ncbi:MAG TPA: amino acid adenylation domain-containing protein, partial [Ktedonobacteraceae bacterium]|nr:amino acid adenylation domain-containing protein [Ktedonobacteraceae bacterium]